MSGLNILVVGSSIAGPATAYWLAKAGCRVTVIERFPHLRTAGQAVDIRTCGVSVMRQMEGMEALVRANRAREDGMCLVREDGRPLGTIRATGNPDQQSLLSEYEILRGDLSKVLYHLTEGNENISYVFGEQVVSMTEIAESNGQVKVDFLNGKPAETFDLVVGCDGVNSRTRAMGFGCGVRDHIFPTGSWISHFVIKKDLLHGSTIGHGLSAVGGRMMAIGSSPPDSSRIMFMHVAPKGRPDAAKPLREALEQGEDAVKSYILKDFSGIGWKSDTVLEEMMSSTSSDFYASEIDQVKIPALYNGRVVLLGDAGYAPGPTGGGTSLALAGAYMLAGEITRNKHDLDAALRGYEEQIGPLVKEMQSIPWLFLSIMAPQSWWGVWLRNRIFALIAGSGIVNFCQKYLAAGFANTESFPLPKYEWVA